MLRSYGAEATGWTALVLVGILVAGCVAPQSGPMLVYSAKSDCSDIRVRDEGGVRSLYFVEPNLEVRQTSMILGNPGHLTTPYTRDMFASMLLKHPQKRVLIVGLGGGAMVRFLNKHFPETSVDAVEIDPEVVKIASKLFGVRSSKRTRIITEDASVYLQRDKGLYDAIYMDAFLEPGADTDPHGIPQELKTVDFLVSLRGKLTPGGVVAFNLSEHESTDQDLQTIARAFPTIYEYRVPDSQNRVVIATGETAATPAKDLRAEGREMDSRRSVGFSFENMADYLSKPAS